MGGIAGPLIGLAGSLFGGGGDNDAAEAQANAAASAAAGQNAINQQIVNIMNSLMAVWEQYYKPLEEKAAGTAMGFFPQVPFVDIAGQTISDLRKPYELPPEIRQKMIDQIGVSEKRSMADLVHYLSGQGIGGGQLAHAMGNLAETFLPQRFGLERDIALAGSEREEARKLQAYNLSQALFSMLASMGQSGRGIPGWAGSTLAQLAGQYAQAGQSAMGSYQPSASGGDLSKSLASLFSKPIPGIYPGPINPYSGLGSGFNIGGDVGSSWFPTSSGSSGSTVMSPWDSALYGF